MGGYTDPQKFELYIQKFCRNIGFKNVNGGSKFTLGSRQVDCVAGFDSTLLVIECTLQKNVFTKIDAFRGSIHEIREGIKQHDVYKKYSKLVFILAIDHQNVTKNTLEKASKNPEIVIWDSKYIDYYQTINRVVKENALYSILAELDIKPNPESYIRVPAFQAQVGKKGRYKLFQFFISAHDLIKFAYVARREQGGETFYQRMVNPKRMTEIAEYINNGKTFPNSIVISLSDNSWSFSSRRIDNDISENWVEFGVLEFGRAFGSCWIIDGQHRLFSHAHATTQGRLCVSAFVGISEKDQAEYFLDINRKSKNVSPNLLWDLLGSISPHSPEGIISNAVKNMREDKNSFFFSDIKIPSLGDGNCGFNSICSTLDKLEFGDEFMAMKEKKRRNPFFDRNVNLFYRRLSKAISNFFSEVNNNLQTEISEKLFSDGFISVMIMVYKIILIHFEKKPSLDQQNEILVIICEYFNRYSSDDIKVLKKNLSSEGGKRDFRNDLVRLLQQEYDQNFGLFAVEKQSTLAEKIAYLEFQLNHFVNSYLSKKINSDWFMNNQYFSDVKQRKTCLQKSETEGKPAWEFLNFNTTINNIILTPSLWEGYFKVVFIKYGLNKKEEVQIFASKLWAYRSSKTHIRSTPIIYSRSEEKVIRSVYELFINLIREESKLL